MDRQPSELRLICSTRAARGDRLKSGCESHELKGIAV
jgi:hypothetical protein